MRVDFIILEATKKLTDSGINTARLDAEVLLAHTLKKNRTWLLTHTDYVLQGRTLQSYNSFIDRRIAREPVAYIVGVKEFYGRDFYVDKHVLVPRPESESFIEILKTMKNDTKFHGFLHQVLDMGTGSGCLGITAKLEFTDMLVTATDTSTSALKVAIKNARNQDASIIFKKQSLLTGDKIGYDVVMANLPYVPDVMQDNSIKHEPPKALFSGTDGLNHYRKLFEQLTPKHIRFVMTESLITQHSAVKDLAKKAGYTLTSTSGLVQLFTKDV